ncbi:MAG: phosphoribosylformylglycinamidine synthase subunit PurL, partial [Solirubrobacteraceae bacterium]|nr:phosphoribosylformylglycinamidine synthase subunit PurL [Solirubrobacteraceae bacterium]
VRSGALRSAHDIAEGGLLVALAECCIASGRGARGELDADEGSLFGEAPGAFVVSGDAEALRAFGAAAMVIGEVGGDRLDLGSASVSVAELTERHAHGLADLLS